MSKERIAKNLLITALALVALAFLSLYSSRQTQNEEALRTIATPSGGRSIKGIELKSGTTLSLYYHHAPLRGETFSVILAYQDGDQESGNMSAIDPGLSPWKEKLEAGKVLCVVNSTSERDKKLAAAYLAKHWRRLRLNPASLRSLASE